MNSPTEIREVTAAIVAKYWPNGRKSYWCDNARYDKALHDVCYEAFGGHKPDACTCKCHRPDAPRRRPAA